MFTDLRALPCGHRFCAGCLETLARKVAEQQQEANDSYDLDSPPPAALQCPMCRMQFDATPNVPVGAAEDRPNLSGASNGETCEPASFGALDSCGKPVKYRDRGEKDLCAPYGLASALHTFGACDNQIGAPPASLAQTSGTSLALDGADLNASAAAAASAPATAPIHAPCVPTDKKMHAQTPQQQQKQISQEPTTPRSGEGHGPSWLLTCKLGDVPPAQPSESSFSLPQDGAGPAMSSRTVVGKMPANGYFAVPVLDDGLHVCEVAFFNIHSFEIEDKGLHECVINGSPWCGSKRSEFTFTLSPATKYRRCALTLSRVDWASGAGAPTALSHICLTCLIAPPFTLPAFQVHIHATHSFARVSNLCARPFFGAVSLYSVWHLYGHTPREYLSCFIDTSGKSTDFLIGQDTRLTSAFLRLPGKLTNGVEHQQLLQGLSRKQRQEDAYNADQIRPQALPMVAATDRYAGVSPTALEGMQTATADDGRGVGSVAPSSITPSRPVGTPGSAVSALLASRASVLPAPPPPPPSSPRPPPPVSSLLQQRRRRSSISSGRCLISGRLSSARRVSLGTVNDSPAQQPLIEDSQQDSMVEEEDSPVQQQPPLESRRLSYVSEGAEEAEETFEKPLTEVVEEEIEEAVTGEHKPTTEAQVAEAAAEGVSRMEQSPAGPGGTDSTDDTTVTDRGNGGYDSGYAIGMLSLASGSSLPMTGPYLVFGSGWHCDVLVGFNPDVCIEHATLVNDGSGKVYIKCTYGGVTVDNEAVPTDEALELLDGDALQISDRRFWWYYTQQQMHQGGMGVTATEESHGVEVVQTQEEEVVMQQQRLPPAANATPQPTPQATQPLSSPTGAPDGSPQTGSLSMHFGPDNASSDSAKRQQRSSTVLGPNSEAQGQVQAASAQSRREPHEGSTEAEVPAVAQQEQEAGDVEPVVLSSIEPTAMVEKGEEGCSGDAEEDGGQVMEMDETSNLAEMGLMMEETAEEEELAGMELEEKMVAVSEVVAVAVEKVVVVEEVVEEGVVGSQLQPVLDVPTSMSQDEAVCEAEYKADAVEEAAANEAVTLVLVEPEEVAVATEPRAETEAATELERRDHLWAQLRNDAKELAWSAGEWSARLPGGVEITLPIEDADLIENAFMKAFRDKCSAANGEYVEIADDASISEASGITHLMVEVTGNGGGRKYSGRRGNEREPIELAVAFVRAHYKRWFLERCTNAENRGTFVRVPVGAAEDRPNPSGCF